MEVVGPGVCGDVEQDWQGVGREAGVRVVLWLAWTEWGVAVWSEVPSVCDGVCRKHFCVCVGVGVERREIWTHESRHNIDIANH